MEKIKVTQYKKPQPRRKDSFWFDGHVATVKSGKVQINIVATGHIDVCFNPNEPFYDNKDAQRIAKKRGYTDKKLSMLSRHDGWGNNNWFGFEVIQNGGESFWMDETETNFDYAIKMAKEMVSERLAIL